MGERQGQSIQLSFNAASEESSSRQLAVPAIWIMLLVAGFVLAGASRADDFTPAQLLETLLSPQTSDQQWQSTEGAFEKVPVETRMQTLFPEIAKGLPGGWTYAAYNCSNPDTDRRVPGWGRYCVANWLWCKALECGRANPQVSKTLLELWSGPLTTPGESALLAALDSNSRVPEAEEPVVSVFKDSDADPHLRQQAVLCLLRHLGTKYHAEAVAYALASQRDVRDVIFKELVEPPHARLSGIDPAVVRLGFWLLFEEMNRNEEDFAHDGAVRSQYGAAMIANHLGTYLGEKFTPDYRLPEYQGEQGREAMWRETTGNALNWWAKNETRFAK
ncbi:MAG: hypothetical protein ABSG27_09780 [Candidatus Acidiferrales bacterium]|jgi:hypothetical protein